MGPESRAKFVIGQGDSLTVAMAAWTEVDGELTLIPVIVSQDSVHAFDLSVLAGLHPTANVTAFVAWNRQFLNLRRSELMRELQARGFTMPPLIEVGALVAASALIGDNTHVGRGAMVGHGTVVGANGMIGAGARVGDLNRIGESAWIAGGAQTGRRVVIGDHATLGTGVAVDDGVDVGTFSIVDRPGRLSASVAAKTFLLASFTDPVVIVN